MIAKATRLNEIARENTERKIRANVSYVRDLKSAEQKQKEEKVPKVKRKAAAMTGKNKLKRSLFYL